MKIIYFSNKLSLTRIFIRNYQTTDCHDIIYDFIIIFILINFIPFLVSQIYISIFLIFDNILNGIYPVYKLVYDNNNDNINNENRSIRPPSCGNGSFMAKHWARSFRNHCASRDYDIQRLRGVEPRSIVSVSNYTGRQLAFAG